LDWICYQTRFKVEGSGRVVLGSSPKNLAQKVIVDPVRLMVGIRRSATKNRVLHAEYRSPELRKTGPLKGGVGNYVKNGWEL